MEEVPRRTLLAPLAFPCFVLCLQRVETEGFLDYQGSEDHFHFTVEPSPGHIRCRYLQHCSLQLLFSEFLCNLSPQCCGEASSKGWQIICPMHFILVFGGGWGFLPQAKRGTSVICCERGGEFLSVRKQRCLS